MFSFSGTFNPGEIQSPTVEEAEIATASQQFPRLLKFPVCPNIIRTMDLWKFDKPVTVAKPVWHSRAFLPPNRMRTAPRNLATPVGKSPDYNKARQHKQTKIATLQELGKLIAALQKKAEQLQEQESEAIKLSTHEEEQGNQHEREAIMSSIHNVVEQLLKQETEIIKSYIHEVEQRMQQQTAEVTEIRTSEQTTRKEVEALKAYLQGVEQRMKQEAQSTRALFATLEQNIKQEAESTRALIATWKQNLKQP
eukprot:gene30451-35461_t